MTIRCDQCNRTFKNNPALQQHLRNSPVHAASFECKRCQRTFRSAQALQQHQESPAHRLTYHCNSCDRNFNSEQALSQHARHCTPKQTPLDTFFTSFKTFPYDRERPPSESFYSLRRYHGWKQSDEESKVAWHRYQDAMRAEFELWYGAEDDLVAWHTLCHAIGIHPPPSTCDGCVRAVRNTHVNIVDLIEWGRQRSGTHSRIQTFESVEALRSYSRQTGKIFRNDLDQEDEGSNVVLRHLLRRMFTVRNA